MILDKIENAYLYSTINPLLAEGFKFITENDFRHVEPGKFFLKENLLYAMVNEYDTKPAADCKPEAHRIYTDIQFIVSGKELIGFQTLNGQEPTELYIKEKDVEFFSEGGSLFTLEEGYFAIFFPDDIHQPCIMIDSPAHVKKVVIKVAFH
jgi:YhcH/YjgK/YiaL family protein